MVQILPLLLGNYCAVDATSEEPTVLADYPVAPQQLSAQLLTRSCLPSFSLWLLVVLWVYF